MAIRIQFNHAGFDALLKSPEVIADLERRGNAIAQASGIECEVETVIGATRARVGVRTATPEAMIAEANDRSLTRAIDAGRS